MSGRWTRPAARAQGPEEQDGFGGAGPCIASRRRWSIVVVRRRELGGAAAAVGRRRAPARPGQFVRPGRPPLHGPPGDDDAGLPSVPEERHRLPEDRRDQRFLPDQPPTAIRSGRSSRRDARTRSWRRPWATRGGTSSSKCGTFRCGPTMQWVSRATDWLAMTEDLPRPDNRVTIAPDGRIRLRVPAEQRAGACAAGGGTAPASFALSATGRRRSFAHSTGAGNTTHQCGTLVFGTDPRDVGARSVLPHARRGEPVRGGRVVLPVVGGGEPGADHHRAGAARGRAHPSRI